MWHVAILLSFSSSNCDHFLWNTTFEEHKRIECQHTSTHSPNLFQLPIPCKLQCNLIKLFNKINLRFRSPSSTTQLIMTVCKLPIIFYYSCKLIKKKTCNESLTRIALQQDFRGQLRLDYIAADLQRCGVNQVRTADFLFLWTILTVSRSSKYRGLPSLRTPDPYIRTSI